jgi:hypothetical protein
MLRRVGGYFEVRTDEAHPIVFMIDCVWRKLVGSHEPEPICAVRALKLIVHTPGSVVYLQFDQPVTAQWSSSMIPSSGFPGNGGGPGFNSRLSPFLFFFIFRKFIFPSMH